MYIYNLKQNTLLLKLNPHISIDCVIFGFDGKNLKILLIERKLNEQNTDLKLPGDFITDDEDLDSAAHRILKELTGLENIYLRQFSVFGSPGRISKKKDIDWLRKTTGLPIERVVTVAYYSLIRIRESKREKAVKNNALW
ncbi:MAG: NUDIX domain-containing protein, partial [Bacteroidales bacterium]